MVSALYLLGWRACFCLLAGEVAFEREQRLAVLSSVVNMRHEI